MNINEIIRKIIVISEVSICAFALVLIIPNKTVADGIVNSEESQTKMSDGFNIGDYVEIGEIPSTNQELNSFIDSYLDFDDTETDEEESEDADDFDEAETIDDTFTASDEFGPDVDKDDWRLILVNKQNFIPDDYEVNLVNINGSKQVDERIAKDLAAMLDKARDDEIPLMIVSAYRSSERQSSLFNNKVRSYMNKGMSYMDAYAEASSSVTVPGCSEHQLGLALDILGSGYSSLNEDFETTKAGIWLKENCADFGFILRYPKSKDYVTGIIYEPWHFRYVGKKHATYIMENEITLEEYLDGK